MRAYRFLFVALLFVPPGAFAETYKIDTAHSRIAFSLHQFVSTMHGVTKPMTLHVKLATPLSSESLPERTRWIVTTDPINRKDFGLMFNSASESISGISNNVTPTIEIEAVK